ncbi:MOSC domain-containing protein [Roseicyclus sp. F158]|uniref:MOSC domain-containing protein n=1 Tax=Tropicimonas omnivorans TaxID=3075590 RepID=A0ABU3DG13_9RHOB|nr:MOSC domain-containing protein [Roseicyclus sp. F158]MDT0682655.1 MOSC domain-containing protein [Roseicyclus sp. F158]
MPALLATRITGTIVWLGRVPDREATLRAEALEEVRASFSGIEGESHGGLTRPSCSRVSTQYPKGTEIRNVRQLSIVSAEELAEIGAEMGLERVDPAWLGASMVIGGIPDFTHLPPSSRLQSISGATLTVDMENQPCHLPAKVIDEDRPGAGRAFKRAAEGRRGVTAWVEREGVLRVGDEVRLHIPGQRKWQGAGI